MDRSLELPVDDAVGWRLVVYEDIQQTFQALIVNWLWRNLMANYPTFIRYAWGQVKPIVQTEGFARYAVRFRDTVLQSIEDEEALPAFTPGAVGLDENSFEVARSQLATFDAVAPRLGALFVIFNRALGGEMLGQQRYDDESSTFPAEAITERTPMASPAMVATSDLPADLDWTLDSARKSHGLGGGTPSIYRCLAQWP